MLQTGTDVSSSHAEGRSQARANEESCENFSCCNKGGLRGRCGCAEGEAEHCGEAGVCIYHRSPSPADPVLGVLGPAVLGL